MQDLNADLCEMYSSSFIFTALSLNLNSWKHKANLLGRLALLLLSLLTFDILIIAGVAVSTTAASDLTHQLLLGLLLDRPYIRAWLPPQVSRSTRC